MYLFSRRARLASGNVRASMAWTIGVTEKVNQIIDLDVRLYTTVFSPEAGTLVWTTFAPDLAALEAAQDKLVVDDGYAMMLDEGAAFLEGGIDDAVLQVIHGETDPNRQIEYASTVQAVCATGNLERGMELGVEIAERAEKITGLPSLFTTALTGPYGSVGWVTAFADVGEMERAEQALATDMSLTRFLDEKLRGIYVEDPTLTQQLIYRRIV